MNNEPSVSGEPETNATQGGNSRWFYVQRGETYGPVSSAELRAAAHLGFIGPDDMVRRSDRTDWVAASSLQGLFRQPD